MVLIVLQQGEKSDCLHDHRKLHKGSTKAAGEGLTAVISTPWLGRTMVSHDDAQEVSVPQKLHGVGGGLEGKAALVQGTRWL